MNIWKLVTCKEKIVAEYTGCRTIHSYRGPDAYMPVFSYEWEGEHYYDIESQCRCSRRRIRKYQSGSLYCIYINPHHPKVITLARRPGIGDVSLLLFGAMFVLLVFLTGCERKYDDPSSLTSETGLDHLQELSEESIWSLSISSEDEETNTSKNINVYLDEQKLIVDGIEKTLTSKQCRELSGLIWEYTYQVAEQKSTYWPQTEEYPAMRILFCYKLWYGDKKYNQSGALCYPDGWQEFINVLESYMENNT